MNLTTFAAFFTVLAATFTVTGCAFENGSSDILVTPEPAPRPIDPTRVVVERAEIAISSTKNLDRIGEVIARRPETTFHVNVTTEGWTATDFELLREFLAAHANVVVAFTDAK